MRSRIYTAFIFCFYADIKIQFLFAGMVPECTSEMATYGDEAGEQDGGEVFSRWLSGDGHVPWSDRVDSVAAAAQPALQCDGRPCEPQLYGLSIAPILRFMSALQLNITIQGASIMALKAWCKNFVELLISDTGTSKCMYIAMFLKNMDSSEANLTTIKYIHTYAYKYLVI